MTITSLINRITFACNGVTTAFPITYPFFSAGDLVVIETTITTGVQVVRTLNSDYTISGTPDSAGHYTNGGTVTAAVAPSSLVTWTIYRDPVALQLTVITEGGSLPAKASIEAPLDYLTMIDQRSRDIVARSLHQPDGDTNAMTTLPPAVARANMFLTFDASGNPAAGLPTNPTFVDPLTTKGDLLSRDAGGNHVRVAVGTDGQELVADSTQTSGMTWKQGLRSLIANVGDLLIGLSAGLGQKIAVGLTGQVLASNPVNAPPISWVNPMAFNGATGLTVIPFNIAQGGWVNSSTTYTAVGSGNYNLFDGTAGDGFIISDPTNFSAIDINITTAANPTTVVYEYWNGTTWTGFAPTLLGIATFNGVGYLQIQWTAGSLSGQVVGGSGTNVPAGNYNIRVRQTVGTTTVAGRAWATHKLSVNFQEVIAASAGWQKVIGQGIAPFTPSLTLAGANGLSTGSVAASTSYYVYMIFNPNTAVWASLIDVAYPTPSVLPSGYAFYAALTAFRTDANKNIIPYTQQRHVCTLRWSVIDIAATAFDGKTATLVSIPDNAIAWMGSHANAAGASLTDYNDIPFSIVADAGWTDSLAQPQYAAVSGGSAYTLMVRILITTARTIYPYAAGNNIHLQTKGYELPGALL